MIGFMPPLIRINSISKNSSHTAIMADRNHRTNDFPRMAAACLAAILCALMMLLPLPMARADPSSAESKVENRIKAAILYNITLLVTWPLGAFVDDASPLIICIARANELASEMERSLQSRSVHGRPLRVVPLSEALPSEALNFHGCHVAYFGEKDTSKIAASLRETAGRPVLSVHESDRTARDGVVRLLRDDDKLRFEINDAAAARNRLAVNSKLLKLAIVVNDW